MVQTILVTGANSYIGAWIVKYLVEKGYQVRGTVRSAAREAQVLDGIAQENRAQLSFVYVNDIATDSFHEAVQGVDGIIHVASPFHFKVTDPEKDLLKPAVQGTLGVLQAAHKYNQANNNPIKRIVITSSFAAVFDPAHGFRPGYSYTEKDWCPLSYEDGVAAKDNPVTAYRASKVCAERAAWDFLKNENPAFTIATVCAPIVIGPRVGGFKSLDDLNTSNAAIWTLLSSGKDGVVPETRVPVAIDGRDVAAAHIAALELLRDRNERYVVSAGTFSQQAVLDIVNESTVIPDSIKSQTPTGTPGQQVPDHYDIDSSKAQQELNITYIPLKQTVEELALQFVDLQKKLAETQQ